MSAIQPPNNGPGDGPHITDADRLAALEAENPGWRCWWGNETHRYWALPPGPGDLIEAPTLTALGERIAQASSRRDLS